VTRAAGLLRGRAGGALVLLGLAGAVLTLRVVAEPMRVSSGSMAPTYREGDEVLVQKIGDRSSAPHRGDVIAFHQPGTGALMVKRVVALAGQRVGIEDGVLVVGATPVREAYVDHATVDGDYFGPVRVPRGAVFVMGDARAGSVDSRTFGPVRTDAVVGRVLRRLW
jgi:signal peptidase I